MKTTDSPAQPIDPQLEARIVAWVLGEASPFEAAELTRLLEANPELAIFKRRIEAVHGLIGETVRPVGPPMVLSAERRAKLLAVIGSTGSPAAEEAASPAPAALAPGIWESRQRRWRKWMIPLAACLVLGVFFSAEFGAKFMLEKKPTRPAPDQTQLGPSGGGAADVVAPLNMPAVAYGSSFEPAVVANEQKKMAYDESLVREKRRFGGDAEKSFEMPALAARDASFAEPAEPNSYRFAGGNKDAPAGSKEQIFDLSALQAGARASLPAVEPAPPAISVTGSSIGIVQTAGSEAQSIGAVRDARRVEFDRAQDAKQLAQNSDSAVAAAKKAAESTAKVAGRVVLVDGAGVTAPRGSIEEKRKNEAAATIPEVKTDRIRDGLDQDLPVARPARSTSEDDKLRVEAPAATQPVSTFSLHVADVSFRLARAALARGQRPDPSTVRPEEFYNAFDYGDPAPATGEPVSCRIEQAAHPFLQQRNLVRVAMKVPATGRGAGQPLRLTLMLDTSGSMEREDRAASVQRAMSVLASLLGPDDRVTLIGFARQPRLLADRIPGNQAASLIDLIARTPAEGGTNLEEALKLAGERARLQFESNAQNRIVVLSDGAANLGADDPAQLAAQVSTLRQQGIAFDACGVGANGLDDSILEALTRQGDGRYYVINSPDEADAGFARQLAGAFRPAAENVKVQVRFNPARVRSYRLIGFEQHRLREEDFRNDRVDAAELAAEEAAVALYQVEVIPEGEGELGDVFVRFRNAASREMVERSWTLSYEPRVSSFAHAAPSLQLAGTAALLAEYLRGGPLAGQVPLDELAPIMTALRSNYAQQTRVQELATMFAQARRLSPR